MTETRILPAQPERVETGPTQFGDDWPGVFIRGDNAFAYAAAVQALRDGYADPFTASVVNGLISTLSSCIIVPVSSVAPPAPVEPSGKSCGSCVDFERNGTRYGGLCTGQGSPCGGMLLSALKPACDVHRYEEPEPVAVAAAPDPEFAEVPPAGYRRLANVACPCPRSWYDGAGIYWCCNRTPWEK